MSLNESIVEDAALEWFLLRQGYGGQIGEQFRFAPTLIPAFSHGEKEEEREAIRRLNPAIPEEAREEALHADKRLVVADFATAQTERRLNP